MRGCRPAPAAGNFASWCGAPGGTAELYAGGNPGRVAAPAATAGKAPATAVRCKSEAYLATLQLAFARRVLALVPVDEFDVLDDVFRRRRIDVLAIVIESDLADDRLVVIDLAQFVVDLRAVGPGLLDRIHHQGRGRIGVGAVRCERLVIPGLLVLFHEELPTRQILDRLHVVHRDHAFGERWPGTLDERRSYHARRSLELRLDAKLIHLFQHPHAKWRQAAEIDHLGIQLLDLGQHRRQVLLIGWHAERR